MLIRISGNGEVPPRDDLIAALRHDFGNEVLVKIQAIPARDEEWVVTPGD